MIFHGLCSAPKKKAADSDFEQESVPARYRGLMISSFQIWTSVGSLIGTIVDNFTAKMMGRESYLIPLGLIYIVPVIMSVGLLIIPESPRWLLEHGHKEKALKSLLWHRPYDQAEAEEELKDMQEALEGEMNTKKNAAIKDMWTHPIDRRRTILAVCAITLQGASGAMYMIGTHALSQPPSLFPPHHDVFRLLSDTPQLMAPISSRWPTLATASRTRAF